MTYKKIANLTDQELNEEIAIQEKGITEKRVFTRIRINNLLNESVRRYEFKIAVAKAELRGMEKD